MHANGWTLPCKRSHPLDVRDPNFGARGNAGQNARHAAKVLARDMLYLCKTDGARGQDSARVQRGTRPASRSEQAATDSAPFAVREGPDAQHGAAADASVERGPGAREQDPETAGEAMARVGGGASRAAAPRRFTFVKASKVFEFLMSGKAS